MCFEFGGNSFDSAYTMASKKQNALQNATFMTCFDDFPSLENKWHNKFNAMFSLVESSISFELFHQKRK